MKTIYKSIALEAALLSVTLALQAEIQSEGETVTADVQASSLDRLKVTLVSPNVSGARDLVASGNATIEGNEIAVNLENLTFGTHRLIVSARFGTQIRTLYALDISVPQAELPNETQEYEDAAIVVSTYGDGGGGGEFPTDYAKQGDDPTATLTDAQAYAQAAAEAAQSLTSLDSDINAGKTAIAAAVTAKGVPTSPTDTMLQMATNVTQIAQAPISINGGEMYAKQLYGSLTTPNYWNLYEVMAQLLSDGRLNNYGGILLAEYYKGYDSLALSGAGAGGAYVVSDVDSNGNFILYTEDTTHVWDTKDDGKGNRWVAYCFNDAGHNFDITDTNTSPRSIHIGRHVGVINSTVAGRASEIVVTDGNILDGITQSGNLTQNWGRKVVVRNLGDVVSEDTLYANPNVEEVYIEANSFNTRQSYHGIVAIKSGEIYIRSVIIKANSIAGNPIYLYGQRRTTFSMILDAEIMDISSLFSDSDCGDYINSLIILTEQCNITGGGGNTSTNFKNLYIGYKTNDKTKSVSLLGNVFPACQKVEIMSGWCKSLNILRCLDNSDEAMIVGNILLKLKQDEADCGDGVTITLGQTNLDKLTSQESIDLLDTLTNTYGYTFA